MINFFCRYGNNRTTSTITYHYYHFFIILLLFIFAGLETSVRPPVPQETNREKWNEKKRRGHFLIDGE